MKVIQVIVLLSVVTTGVLSQMDCVANGMACDPAGTKKCCEGNKCELDPKTNTNVCKFQCTKLNELCQPVADPEFDMCCEGTKCDYSTTSKAFVCIPKDLEPVCLEPGSSCSSAGKPCCSPANCVSGTCSSEPECLKEGSQCSSSGTACCSPANCVSGTCRTEPQCLKEYATCYTFGTRCCEGMTCTNYKCRKPDSQCIKQQLPCDPYGGTACCSQLSCHAENWSGGRPVCQTRCAPWGATCGRNTRCCNTYCDYHMNMCR